MRINWSASPPRHAAKSTIDAGRHDTEFHPLRHLDRNFLALQNMHSAQNNISTNFNPVSGRYQEAARLHQGDFR
jgi:hypothetical protein